MQGLVREGYELGNYEQAFRLSTQLSEFEARIFGRFTDLLPAGARILDLGCGTGIPYDLYLSELGYRLTGVDFCRKHLSRATELVPEAGFVCCDILDYCFPSASFDAILSLYTLFHLPRSTHGELLTMIYRSLKKDGVVLLTMGTSDSEYGEEVDWLGAPMAWSTYAPSVYNEMITDSGLGVVDSWYEGNPGDEEYHWWVLARKGRGSAAQPPA